VGATETCKLMGGIYEARRRDEVRCQDINTGPHKDWLRHSEINREGCRACCSVVVEALCYKQNVAGSRSEEVIQFFHFT
jgi:hypothetical protein